MLPTYRRIKPMSTNRGLRGLASLTETILEFQPGTAREKKAALTQLQVHLSVLESKGTSEKAGRTLSDGGENKMKPVQNPYILDKIDLSEFVSAFESISGG